MRVLQVVAELGTGGAEAVEDDVGSNRGPGGVGAGFSLRIRPTVVVPRCKPARASVWANFFLPMLGQSVLSRCTT